jgi:hypothetical protein
MTRQVLFWPCIHNFEIPLLVIHSYGTNICNFNFDSYTLTKGSRGNAVKESYTPNPNFVGYLDAYLQHETLYQKKYQEKLRKISAGKKLTEEEEITEAEEKKRDLLQRRSVYWLNKCVFPSMANLTVFLEYVTKSEELRKVFDDELKELFLGRKIDEQERDYGSGNQKKRLVPGPRVFERFIQAAIKFNWSKKENDKNFRLGLIHIIERVLYQHLNGIGANLLDSAAKYVVSQDSQRMLAWAELLARNVDMEVIDDVDKADRKVLF